MRPPCARNTSSSEDSSPRREHFIKFEFLPDLLGVASRTTYRRARSRNGSSKMGENWQQDKKGGREIFILYIIVEIINKNGE